MPGHHAGRQHAREERTRSDQDHVGALDRLDGDDGRGRVGRFEADAPDRRGAGHLL
jgi:hypothetical protein